MRRLPLVTFIGFSVCLTITVGSAKGQSTGNLRVNIPFDFNVLGQDLTAGEYMIGRVNAGNPAGLLIQDTRGKATFFFTQNVEALEVNRQSALIFRRYRGQYFLSEIWRIGEMSGRRLSESKNEKQHSGRGEGTVVTIVYEACKKSTVPYCWTVRRKSL